MFHSLSGDDVLFVDSSHVSKAGSGRGAVLLRGPAPARRWCARPHPRCLPPVRVPARVGGGARLGMERDIPAARLPSSTTAPSTSGFSTTSSSASTATRSLAPCRRCKNSGGGIGCGRSKDARSSGGSVARRGQAGGRLTRRGGRAAQSRPLFRMTAVAVPRWRHSHAPRPAAPITISFKCPRCGGPHHIDPCETAGRPGTSLTIAPGALLAFDPRDRRVGNARHSRGVAPPSSGLTWSRVVCLSARFASLRAWSSPCCSARDCTARASWRSPLARSSIA